MNRHNDDQFMSVNECTHTKWPQNSREKPIMRFYNGWPVMNPVNYRKYMLYWLKGSLCRTRSRTYSSDHWKRIRLLMSLCESCQLISGSGIFTRSDLRSNRDDRRHFLTAIVLPSIPGNICYQEVFLCHVKFNLTWMILKRFFFWNNLNRTLSL